MAAQVILCGAVYGSTYLRGLSRAHDVRVVGVLGRGGAASQAQARAHGVAYHRSPDTIHGVDAAIVAVGGAAGVALAERFLRRGIPVLQEHPISAADMERLHHIAASHGVSWHLNSHFADLPTVQPLIVGAHQLMAADGLPTFITLTCNPRTLFSALDILRRALGRLGPTGSWQTASTPGFFSVSTGICAGTQATVMCQRTVSAVDDGSATLVCHHLQLGFSSGVLELVDMAGPVLWRPDTFSTAVRTGEAPMWDVPPPQTPPHLPQFQQQRDAASAEAVRTLLRCAGGQPPPFWQTPDHQREVTRVWEIICAAVGPPVLLG